MGKKGPPTKTIEVRSADLARGEVLAGRYEVQEELGRGGMGRVLQVLDREIGEPVALKLLNPDVAADRKTIDRFRNELKFARRIAHRNVCRMYDLHRDGDTYFITMEYVAGEDLKSVIERRGPLPPEEALSVVGQVCLGLAEAHRLGVTHRDLKPQNIMIDEQGAARIMDFGIARIQETRGLTEEGTIIGTPEYMSPEQVEGGEPDPRSDIYSLGVVLYELVTGKPPFEGGSALSVACRHKTEPPPDPRKLSDRVSDELAAVILKCLEKKKEERYQTAEEFCFEIDRLREGTGNHALPRSTGTPGFLAGAGQEAPVRSQVFVARERELALLGRWLEAALAGNGRVGFITGEAGSGKTALLREFARRALESDNGLIVASGKCNAHTGIGDPYFPFIEIMGLLTGEVEARWAAGAISRTQARRLWELVPFSTRALLEIGPDLVNVFVPGASLVSRSAAAGLKPAEGLTALKALVDRKASMPADSTLQQSTLFEQYTRLLLELAGRRPLLLVLDDLQWMDAGSAGLLFHLGRRIAGSQILVLGGFRSSEVDIGRGAERHPIEPIRNEFRTVFGEMEIELGTAEDRPFVDALIDSEPNRLDEEFRRMLAHLTKGHPLFTVELLRTMQERGALIRDGEGRWGKGPEFNWDTLPARIDAVIEERITRLDDRLRETLTIASVEGEEFTAEVIARLQDTEVFALVRRLSRELEKRHRLVSAKGIRQISGRRLSLYLFQHILFQRYLYNSLDAVERAHLHGQVGLMLEGLYGEETEEISVQLARHFFEAGTADKAIEYLRMAGQRAVRLSANEEAIAHYRKALGLVLEFPESPERDERELALQLALIAPETGSRGPGSPETTRAVLRAQELGEKIGDSPQLFTVLVQLAFYYGFARAEYRTGLKYADQVARIAERTGDPLQQAICAYTTTWPLLNVGELRRSLDSARHMAALYDPARHGFLAHVFSFDLGILSMGLGAWALWFLGYPDQAREGVLKTLERARQLGHPYTLDFILVGVYELFWFLGEAEKALPYLAELAAIADEKGFIYWQAHAVFYRGERLVLEGSVREGTSEMHRGLEIMRAIGTLTCYTRLLTRMAAAYLQAGEIEAGLAAVDEAGEIKCRFDERYMEAEIFRLKGELLLKKGEDPKASRELFEQAIAAARAQEAKSMELRAAISLSRLLKARGQSSEAIDRLAEIFGWFSEGFETRDLKEAKALLAALRA